MGADIVGWRSCPLQQQLGKSGFLQKLKMKSYLAAIESQVPEGQRAGIKITVLVNDNRRELTYEEIRGQAESFQRGSPECASCPVGWGRPLGCYHFITYPVDEAFEETAFDFFTSQLATKDSISDQLYRDVVSKRAANGDWHTRRPQLARRAQPLTFTWGGMFSKRRVDSAQLLAGLFIPLEIPALIAGYARFWNELVKFVDAKVSAELGKRGITLERDGQITYEISERELPQIAQKMGRDIAAIERYLTGTLREIRAMAPMMTAVAVKCLEPGYGMIVDG